VSHQWPAVFCSCGAVNTSFSIILAWAESHQLWPWLHGLTSLCFPFLACNTYFGKYELHTFISGAMGYLLRRRTAQPLA
jgi:hypothetical protein